MGIEDLYRDVILDHYSHPRNRGRLQPADVAVEGVNPLCGDELTLYLRVREGKVEEARFEGRGCSISQASTSMMTELVKGKTVEEVRSLSAQFKLMMHGKEPAEELGDIVALRGVSKFPVRVKCATLPWVTLEQGLEDAGKGRVPRRVSTEDPAG